MDADWGVSWENIQHFTTQLLVNRKMTLRNQCRNPILVMHQNPHLGSASDWLKTCVNG